MLNSSDMPGPADSHSGAEQSLKSKHCAAMSRPKTSKALVVLKHANSPGSTAAGNEQHA